MIRALEAYPQVVVLDTAEAIIRSFALNPPTVGGRKLVGPPLRGGYDHIFADKIHPTAVSNALLANLIIDRMNARWKTRIPKYSDAELKAKARIR